MSRKYSYDMEVNKISNMTLEEICVGRFNYSGGCPAAILKFKKEIMLIGFDNINNSLWFTAGPKDFWFLIEKSADSNVAVNSSGFIKKCPKVLDNLDLPKKYDSFYIKPKDKYKEYELLSSSFVYVDEETGELFAKTKKENRIIGARK